jgi:hypothetical protein
MDEPGNSLRRHSRPAPFDLLSRPVENLLSLAPNFSCVRLAPFACPVLVQSLSIGMCGWTKNASEKSYNTVDVLGTHFMIRLDVVGAWN